MVDAGAPFKVGGPSKNTKSPIGAGFSRVFSKIFSFSQEAALPPPSSRNQGLA
jgi:hypothetical protein